MAPQDTGRAALAGVAVGVFLVVCGLMGSSSAQSNSPPDITSVGPFSVDEGTTAVTTLTADDSDNPSGELTWTKTGGADESKFSLSSAGVLTFGAAKNFEVPDDADKDGSYKVTVQVSDGEATDSADLVVKLSNVIELTAVSGPASASTKENSFARLGSYSASSEADQDGITWSLTGTDAAHFSIDEPPGALRFAEAADYESPQDQGTNNVYDVTVVASASGSSMNKTVAVTVTDEDETGVLSLSSTRPSSGTALTATLSDPDGITDGTTTWGWERSTGRNKWVSISGATSASYTPVAADTNAFLRVKATYDDEHGGDHVVEAVTAEVVAGPRLTGLTAVSNNSTSHSERAFSPAFSSDTLHYRIGCNSSDSLTVTPAAGSGARIAIDGKIVASQSSKTVPVTASSTVEVTVSDTSGALTTYYLHCYPHNLALASPRHASGATGILEDLLLHTPGDYLVIMDNQGVPRFKEEIGRNPFIYFRLEAVDDDFRYIHGLPEQVAVIRDEQFNRVRTVSTVTPLVTVDGHDQRLLDGGSALLMAYEPAVRDLSDLPFKDPEGNDWGSSENIKDSAIQIVSPQNTATFTWNSWGVMPLEDCRQHRFLDGYAHINSLQMVDGIIIASFRGCGKILAIDPTVAASHKVKWRVGESNLTSQEWADGDFGPAPLDIVGDPERHFCGQHAAHLLPNGHLLVFDNGIHCLIDEWGGDPVNRDGDDYSRVVEYALDHVNGEAVFVRDHSFNGTETRFGKSGGHVEPLANGDWLISWGRQIGLQNPPSTVEVFTQVDPSTGKEKFGLVMPFDQERERATVMPAWLLAPSAEALTAKYPASSYTSTSHSGANDSVSVVVAFSRPVVDFSSASPSLKATGATITSVSPHLVAGEAANAYLISLTPQGNGKVTIGVAVNKLCASGGICAADGTKLSDAPNDVEISGPQSTPVIPGPVISGPTTSGPVSTGPAPTEPVDVDKDFYSGHITGPDFCTNLSLGGPLTYAYDSNGDGVADICSLPYTRREAIARQNALTKMASLDPDEFLTQVRSACGTLTGDYGDAPEDLAADVCTTNQLTETQTSIVAPRGFYSGSITGPDWCTNHSLGGPPTFAYDSNDDGVADVCSLPYTRREAIARQIALEAIGDSDEDQFRQALAEACLALGTQTFGDPPQDLATDACAA